MPFAVGVIGLTSTSLPLPGPAGCALIAAPDILTLYLPALGNVTTELFLPAMTSLIGLNVLHQVVAVDFDAIGQLETLTTNALSWTIGSYCRVLREGGAVQ